MAARAAQAIGAALGGEFRGCDDSDRKAKPGLMRRWFSGAEPATREAEPGGAHRARGRAAAPGGRRSGRGFRCSGAQAKLAPAAAARPFALLDDDRAGRHRHFHQAQARRRLARRSRGRSDPGRSRPRRRRRASARRSRTGATSKDIEPGGGQADPGRRGRARARAGRPPAHDRSGQAPVRHPGRRRQRLRQDDDHRQARRQVPGRRQDRSCSPPATRSARRRSSSCASGRARTGSDLVERDQGADAAGLAFDALTRARELERRHRADGHGRAPAEPRRTDERTREDRPGDEEGRRRSAPHAVLLVLDATVGQNASARSRSSAASRASPGSS